MIVGLLFDADIKNGGSYHMSINNLVELRKSFKKLNFKCIILTHEKNLVLEKLKVDYEIIKLTFFDYIFIILRNIKIINYLINKKNLISSFEKKLLKKNINLLIFLFVSYKSFLLRKLKFISTVLDVCHKDFLDFKEVKGLIFHVREYLNKKILPLSHLIITESVVLKKKIVKFYKLNSDKIISIPNLPSKLVTSNLKINLNAIKKKYNINSKFYFYPAQFWSHKNHIILLEAVKKLKKNKVDVNFIFCGEDKGNLSFIKKKILEFKIENNIKILGYISNNEVVALYRLCDGLVMPTYFGPTNIPPVEAWFLGVPVVYSSYLYSHGLDAALYFNPKSSGELIKAINKLEVSHVRKKLILKGKIRIKQIKIENRSGHLILQKKLKSLVNY
jgi:glycosyltransferase involved in cell wall biosynthesis